MRRVWWTVWALTLGFGVLSNGCGATSCPEVAWDGPAGLEITATQADGGAIAAGRYDFRVVADGIVFTAQCDPTRQPASACAFEAAKSSNIHVQLIKPDKTPMHAFAIRIVDNVDGAYSENISGPETATLTIDRDGTRVATGDVTPESYRREEPNGEGCGFVDHAEYMLTMDGPSV